MANRFPLGRVLATPGVLATLDQTEVFTALARHQTGDWGDVCPDDFKANEQAIVEGTRLLSVYHDNKGVKFWIITEADRSATTILLPSEY